MAIVPLASGLGGAIGSDFSATRNRVYLVEYDGKLSRVDLVRGLVGTVSAGTGATLRGTFHFDLDVGSETSVNSDMWWEQMTSTARQLVPENGATFAYVGVVAYDSLSYADLQQLTYSATAIDGSVGASNRLVPGAVFAVRTSAGNYAKVRVSSYGYNLVLDWRTYRLQPAYAVLGTGYNEPEDIALSSDGVHAYVTERTGALLRVDLGAANRASATVLTSGMTAPHQLVLDEVRGVAYLVEFAAGGRLFRVDLTSGARTVLFAGLDHAIGLAMSADGQTAYVTEQAAGGSRLSRVSIPAGRRETLTTGLVSPFFLEWADPARASLYIVERDPQNRILVVDLAAPATPRVVVSGLPSRPSSMVAIPGARVVVCCNSEVALADLSSVFTASGPYFLGIGHVPFDRISADGYATTDPGYFFQVTDCPFGGTLTLNVNHDRGYADGARYYQVLVDGVVQRVAFSDYEWVGLFSQFVLQTVKPDDNGYFSVRAPTSLWYNHWFGYMLDTTKLTDGTHTIELRLFSAANAASQLVSSSVTVLVDNTGPLVTIDSLQHQKADGTWETVGTCAIVDSGNNAFRAQITARDTQKHLSSWSLSVTWGDNQSAGIDAGAYVPVPSRLMEGPVAELHPAAPWVATEKHCAHTFRLGAWDRVINGWGFIHYAEYSKSITLMLP
jgi:hypothetical protein